MRLEGEGIESSRNPDAQQKSRLPAVTRCRQPIPDTPENIAKAVLSTPPKKPKDWDYLQNESRDNRRK